MLFAPVERDLRERVGAKHEPIRLDLVLLEAVSRNNSLGDLPFLLLPSGNFQFLPDTLLCLAQKIIRHGLDPTGAKIQKRRRLVELHFQRVDEVLQENSRGHIFKKVILAPANPSAVAVDRDGGQLPYRTVIQ